MQVLALIGCMVSFSGCVLSGDAIDGRVLEEGTNKPIPGAIVVARWQGHLATWAHGKTVCYHVLTTTTDAEGRFRLPPWEKEITKDWQKNVRFERVVIDVYSRGFGLPVRINDGVYYLAPYRGSVKDRLEYLARIAVSCTHERDVEINLLPLYKALYEEASRIAVTREEKIKALHHLKDIEKLEVGSTRAWENFHRREKDLK